MSKDLLIVDTAEYASRIQTDIADDGMMQSLENSNERFYVVSPCAPLGGRRFANCLMSRKLHDYLTNKATTREQEEAQRWWDEQAYLKFYDALIIL